MAAILVFIFSQSASPLLHIFSWGIPYLPDWEIGRAPMKVGQTAAPVESLTISIDSGKAGGTLRIEWGTKSAAIPFTVAP